MIIRDAHQLKALVKVAPWYAETRPHQVKKLGFEPKGLWAVGPAEPRRVRWLFALEDDQKAFSRLHRGFLLVAGYLGPLVTETRNYQ